MVFSFGDVFSSYSIGVIKAQSTFYVFDSHSRDKFGLCQVDCVACVTKHGNVGSLIAFMHNLSQSLGLSHDSLFEVVNVSAHVEMSRKDAEQKNSMCIDKDDEDNIPIIHLRNGNDLMYAVKNDSIG